MYSKARLWEADLMEHLTFNRYENEPLRNKTYKRILNVIQHMSCSRQLRIRENETSVQPPHTHSLVT